MIAVIVPVHNEQECLEGCLRALIGAIDHYVLSTGVAAVAFVVLDTCSDSSKSIAEKYDVVTLECDRRSVGATRALGAEAAIAAGATWLAFTDADTHVAPDWLSCQSSLGSDAVCGTIGVYWTTGMDVARQDFELNYQDADDHRHIHGANFGLSVCAYREVGGFSNRECHEDVALVKLLLDAGRHIAWSAKPRVMTSARIVGRTPVGFATALKSQMAVTALQSIPVLAALCPLSADERLQQSFLQLEM